MKKLLAITALTLLSVGLAAAQSPQEMGNTATPGATFVTGVVVSTTADTIVLRKDSGETLTVFHNAATVGNHNPAVGSRIQVNYKLDQGRSLATEIRGPAEGATATATATVTPPAAPLVPAPAPTVSAQARLDPTPPPTVDVDVDVDTDEPDVDVDIDADAAALPATASKGPAFALFGLLALVAAAALRVTR